MYTSTFPNVSLKSFAVETYDFVKNNDHLLQQVEEDNVVFVNDRIIFNNDVISYMFNQMYKNKLAGFVTPRIHNQDHTVFYNGGDFLINRKKEDDTIKNVLLLSHQNLNTSYSYNLNEVRVVSAICEKVFACKTDFIKRVGFNTDLKKYYYGFDLGVKAISANKLNYVVSDAVTTFFNKDIPDDFQTLNRDYKEVIVPLVGVNHDVLSKYVKFRDDS